MTTTSETPDRPYRSLPKVHYINNDKANVLENQLPATHTALVFSLGIGPPFRLHMKLVAFCCCCRRRKKNGADSAAVCVRETAALHTHCANLKEAALAVLMGHACCSSTLGLPLSLSNTETDFSVLRRILEAPPRAHTTSRVTPERRIEGYHDFGRTRENSPDFVGGLLRAIFQVAFKSL